MRPLVLASILSLALSPALNGCQSTPQVAGQGEFTLAEAQAGQVIAGFTLEALYTGADGGPIGGRFRHGHTGFVFDAVNLQSVPQGFIWVTSFPVSDRGEPHTQEHLLLGKGNMGRRVAGLEDMELARSTAYTQQWQTCYHFHTPGGASSFFNVLEHKLDALLHPDYTDEEIRREVHHYAVKGEGEALTLEEKGTVYQEMSTTFERPFANLWRLMLQSLYGPEHPLALSAGGTPDAIRTMTPEHIRQFHAEHYQLGNMGMIGSFPNDMPVAQTLAQMDGMLRRLQPEASGTVDFKSFDDLPEPTVASRDEVWIAPYPSASAEVPGDMVFVYPPKRALTGTDLLLLELFIENLASSGNSNLYRKWIDQGSREIDLGATEVYGWVAEGMGQPIYLGIGGVPASQMKDETVRDMRAALLAEVQEIAGYGDDDERLVDFNRRLAALLVSQERQLNKLVNSPPQFGFRRSGGAWTSQMQRLEAAGGFRRSVTLADDVAEVRRILEAGGNIWTERLNAWGLVDDTPLMFMNQASPQMVIDLKEAQHTRLDAKSEQLRLASGQEDMQVALAEFKAQYDATTAELEAATQATAFPDFTDNPPMTLDDALIYSEESLGDGAIPHIRSVFNNMTGATVGMNLDITGVQRDALPYLAALPALLTQVGVMDGQAPLPYDQMVERLQGEVLEVESHFVANGQSGRVELRIDGAGGTLAESQAALSWMGKMLYHPLWTKENLPRIQGVVAELYTSLRSTNRRSEETWVRDPASAYRYQDNTHYLATQSFMTRTRLIQRLQWRLTDPGDEKSAGQVDAFLSALSAESQNWDREMAQSQLDGLLTGTSGDKRLRKALIQAEPAAKGLMERALTELKANLVDLPDGVLGQDLSALCDAMAVDLKYAPAQVLEDLNTLMASLRIQSGTRMDSVGSEANLIALKPGMEALVSPLGADINGGEPPAQKDWIIARLNARGVEGEPVFTGLLNPNSQGGVFVHSAPNTGYLDGERDDYLNYLAAQLYSGAGGHGLFMRTWGAGLAYSNGIRNNSAQGLISYYAERSPDLPQTLSFVIDVLEAGTPDPALVDYAIVQGFKQTRAPNAYESRAEGMADDLTDGLTPDRIRAFRQGLLDLRAEGDLTEALFSRMPDVYGKVLPGYGPASNTVSDAVLMTIGPEHQLESYQSYLHEVEGPDAEVIRLYPRDFWLD